MVRRGGDAQRRGRCDDLPFRAAACRHAQDRVARRFRRHAGRGNREHACREPLRGARPLRDQQAVSHDAGRVGAEPLRRRTLHRTAGRHGRARVGIEPHRGIADGQVGHAIDADYVRSGPPGSPASCHVDQTSDLPPHRRARQVTRARVSAAAAASSPAARGRSPAPRPSPRPRSRRSERCPDRARTPRLPQPAPRS